MNAPPMLALPAADGPVFELSEALLSLGCEASRNSARKRIIFPIHRTQDALVQRMLNFMQPGTWIIPHRHPLPHAIETVQILRGALGFLIFEPDGAVRSTHRLSADSPVALIDIEPGLWHGMVVLAPDTVLLEIKRGPYEALTDKEFAPWAPGESDPGTDAWSARWEALFA
jgi:cupin fold WbuC family metalloprotein